MNYTIATLECPYSGASLDFVKDGNGYIVGYSHEGQHTSRKFGDINEAYKIFEKISSWIIYGLYSHTSRREYLLTGTMQ